MAMKREAALSALHAVLAAIAGVKVLRNAELPEAVPPEGLIILRDGMAGEPQDVTISPVSFSWRHRAELEIFVRGDDAMGRAQRLDDLIAAVEQAIAADRTLGGAVDHARPGPPEEPEDLALEGAQSFKAAIVPVFLDYTSAQSSG